MIGGPYAHDAMEFPLALRLPPLKGVCLHEDLLKTCAVMMQG